MPLITLILPGESMTPEERPLLEAAAKGLMVKMEKQEHPELYYMFRFDSQQKVFLFGIRYQVLRGELNPQDKYPEMFKTEL